MVPDKAWLSNACSVHSIAAHRSDGLSQRHRLEAGHLGPDGSAQLRQRHQRGDHCQKHHGLVLFSISHMMRPRKPKPNAAPSGPTSTETSG